jgi:hypothetical protein
MRVIVLDDITNERSGIIPELKSGASTGSSSNSRNSVECPFVFTSREDMYGQHSKISGELAPKNRLTIHETVHGADMVIRQMIDPAFHEIMEEYFRKYRSLMIYISRNGALKAAYAATNRDEFLAEVVTICKGGHADTQDYARCGLQSKDDVRRLMPDMYEEITKYFII